MTHNYWPVFTNIRDFNEPWRITSRLPLCCFFVFLCVVFWSHLCGLPMASQGAAGSDYTQTLHVWFANLQMWVETMAISAPPLPTHKKQML